MICGVFIALKWPGWSEASRARWIFFKMTHIIMEINERMRFTFVASGWNMRAHIVPLKWKLYPKKKKKKVQAKQWPECSLRQCWIWRLLHKQDDKKHTKFGVRCIPSEVTAQTRMLSDCHPIKWLCWKIAYNHIQQTWRSVTSWARTLSRWAGTKTKQLWAVKTKTGHKDTKMEKGYKGKLLNYCFCWYQDEMWHQITLY